MGWAVLVVNFGLYKMPLLVKKMSSLNSSDTGNEL
jgi:hypothetical protein